MRVLVTGAAGQLGREVVAAFAGHDVTAADRTALDIVDRDAVLGLVTGLRPDVVVNTAAWTAVDDCEGDPARAMAANGLAVRHVGEAARRVGAHLCQISTDYVFDGTKADAYDEWDEPSPRSAYGRSKLAGEREAGPEATVIRTSWVSGAHGPNTVKTILRLAAQPGDLSFVDDQRGHPTFADDLATMVRLLAGERRPGCYHVTNQGAVSWYEFARAVLDAGGHDPDRVHPVATSSLDPPRPAPRPANSVLENAALARSGVTLLDDFHEPLGRLVAALEDR